MADVVKDGKFKGYSMPEKKGKESVNAPGAPVERWWLADEETLSQAVAMQLQQLVQNERQRLDLYNRNAYLYGNHHTAMWNGYVIEKSNTSKGDEERNGFNLIQSCTDTLVSKIAKNKPKPFCLTSNGDEKMQRRAKKMNAFGTGVFYENKAYQMGPLAFRDSCVWGCGVIQVTEEFDRVKWDRVLAGELFTDYLECHYGPQEAKTLHRVRNMDRMTLSALYPKKAAQIAAMSLTSDVLQGITKSTADTVTVIESWRLPSAPGASDGVNCVTTGKVCLDVDRYDKDFFPFAVLRYSPSLYGFWAQSLADQLVPIQLELNRILRTIQRGLYLGGVWKFLHHSGANVTPAAVNNAFGQMVEWSGTVEPKWVTPPLIPAELYEQVQVQKQLGYEQSGISQLSATSQKPAGLNSGEAQRVYLDNESDRFQMVAQAYENFHIDLFALSVSTAKGIHTRLKTSGKTLTVKSPGKKFLQTVDWDEVDMPDDAYVLQTFPISKLPSDPSGRMQTIQEWAAAGWITATTAKRLMDYPDLDAEENLSEASADYLFGILDEMVEKGTYTAPEQYDDLQEARRLALMFYNAGKRDGLAEDRLELLRDFLSQLDDLTPPAPMPGAPGPAPANPMPTPTSDLVPNVNTAAPGAAA